MENKKSSGRTILAHVVLIILAFLCLFFFYILIVNATRSHAQLQLGFSALPGSSLLANFKSVINDPAIPILKGIQNSLIVSGCCAAIVTYFSALTAYGIYAYDFKLKRAAFTFIMAILVMPTQVTALGFLRLITGMGLDDSLIPLIIPSIASPAVFYFMHSYMQSSLPKELIEAARIDGSHEFGTFNRIVLPIMKPAIAVQAIFTFVGSWNNYFIPALVITSKSKQTLPIMKPAIAVQAIFTFVGSWNNYFVPALVITSKSKQTLPIMIATLRGADYMNFDMGKIYMMITIAIVPIIVIYLLLSKFIVEGVTLGGVKE